jgi:hypothetical protein
METAITDAFVDDRRSERDAYNHALIGHFVAHVAPGARFQRVSRDPPDYVIDAAGGRIGIELTEVQPEHVLDDVYVTVTGPWRHSEAKRGNKALHQHNVRRQIMKAAEARYTGPPAHVRPSWSPRARLRNSDIGKLSTALADVVGARTNRAPSGGVMLGWNDLAASDLTGFINGVRVDWGGRITQPMWASGFPVAEVSPDAIQRTIDEKDAHLVDWSQRVPYRWLLLTLSLESERILDSASGTTYTTAFEAVYCCDARLRFVPLSVSPG